MRVLLINDLRHTRRRQTYRREVSEREKEVRERTLASPGGVARAGLSDDLVGLHAEAFGDGDEPLHSNQWVVWSGEGGSALVAGSDEFGDDGGHHAARSQRLDLCVDG